jgi:hypothetical protein
VYDNTDITSILTDLLFPYVEPGSLSISTSEKSGTFEYGTVITISEVTPTFTEGSEPIVSIKIGTTKDEDDLYSGTRADSGKAITLTKSKGFDGTTSGTIYCTINDGQTDKSAYATVRYTCFTYYAVTDTVTNGIVVVPNNYDNTKTLDENRLAGNWVPVGSDSISDIEIEAKKDQYIWIASTQDFDVTANADPKEQYGICQLNELSGKYNSAASTLKAPGQTLINSNDYTCTQYNFYRLNEPRADDTKAKFKLGKGD